MIPLPRIGVVLGGNLNRLNGKQRTELRHRHTLPVPMPLPVPHGGQQALQQKRPAHGVGDIRADTNRVIAVRPQVAGIAGGGLHHQFRCRAIGPWSVFAKGREQAIDQVRIQRP